jgi:hypothetical protein
VARIGRPPISAAVERRLDGESRDYCAEGRPRPTFSPDRRHADRRYAGQPSTRLKARRGSRYRGGRNVRAPLQGVGHQNASLAGESLESVTNRFRVEFPGHSRAAGIEHRFMCRSSGWPFVQDDEGVPDAFHVSPKAEPDKDRDRLLEANDRHGLLHSCVAGEHRPTIIPEVRWPSLRRRLASSETSPSTCSLVANPI